MLDEKTRFTGLPNVQYSPSNKTTRALLNAGWARAPLPVQKTVYDITIELLDLYCSRQGKKLTDPKLLAEEARLTAQAYSRFCSYIIKSYDQLRREEHECINPTVEAMIAPANADSPTYQGQSDANLRAIKAFRKLIFDSMLESHPEGLRHFFSLLHRKGFADRLAEQVKEHDFSMKVGAAYRHWLKRNTREPANDSLKFAAVHAGTVPASDITGANEHELLIIINQRRESAGKLRDKASCPVQREIHSRLLNLLDCCEKGVRGDFAPRLRDQFISEVALRYSRVYLLAASHFHSFGADDREEIGRGLSTLLIIPAPTTLQLSSMSVDEYKTRYLNDQKEVMEQFPRETYGHFFQSLYQYGFENIFKDRISAHAVSGKMKGAYDAWALENKNWINNKEWLKEPKAVAPREVIKLPPDPPTLSPILNSEPTPVRPAPLTLKETLAMASLNPEVFVTPKPETKAAPIQEETPMQRYERQMRERDERKKKANGWDLTEPVKPNSVHVVVKPLVKGPDFSELTLEQLEEMTKPSTPVAVEVPAEEVEAIQTSVEAPATSEIRPIIRTALNIIGCDEDSRDSMPGQGKKIIEAKYANGENGHPAQDRHGILLGALATDEVTGKLIYPYIQPIDPNASVKVYPYNVIDIEYIVHDDVERARILVCDFQGFATFICRDTEEFDPDDEISINQLRDDPKVWMVPFINQAQWIREIQQRLYTPAHEMEVQLKRSHFWKNRASALEDTLLHLVVSTGKEPERTTKVFDVGPLAGQATGMAADAALKRHTVEGFEEAGSLKCLFKLMCEKHPGLAKFIGDKPFRVSAQDVCAQVQAEKIADWKRAVFELAFKYDAVDGLDAVVTGARPQSFDEFVMLVRKPGGEDRPELSL